MFSLFVWFQGLFVGFGFGFFKVWLCNDLKTRIMILLTQVRPVLVLKISVFCEGVPFARSTDTMKDGLTLDGEKGKHILGLVLWK